MEEVLKQSEVTVESSQPTTSKEESSAIKGITSTDKSVKNLMITDEENQQDSYTLCEEVQSKNTLQENTSHVSSSSNCSNFTKDESNIHYEGDLCIYTDPATKFEYIWNVKKEEWCLRSDSDQEIAERKNEDEEKAIKMTERQDTSKGQYGYENNRHMYTDTTDENNIKRYFFDDKTNSWKLIDEEQKTGKNPDSESEDEEEEEVEEKKEVIRQDMSKGEYGYENDTHTYTDATDGTVYLWDKEKSAWFPKVDEDFLAQYQMNYGFVDPKANTQDQKAEEEKKKAKEAEAKKLEGKRKAQQEPTWFDAGEDCAKVYVSNLPLDLSEQEFVDLMQKCGLVMKDLDTGKMKVKLYTEPKSGSFKGDALCTYIKKESVNLALDLLDGYTYRDKKIKVERASFTMKGDSYDASLKPKKKKKKDKEKMKKIQEKLFDWRPDKLRHERGKNEQVVIVKNLFDPQIFNKDVGLILEYQQDLHEECLKCGAVRRVIIYDRHPEGVAQINFKEAEAADACVQLLNNRWFGQRQITAETWDGKTKYKVFKQRKKQTKDWKVGQSFWREQIRVIKNQLPIAMKLLF